MIQGPLISSTRSSTIRGSLYSNMQISKHGPCLDTYKNTTCVYKRYVCVSEGKRVRNKPTASARLQKWFGQSASTRWTKKQFKETSLDKCLYVWKGSFPSFPKLKPMCHCFCWLYRFRMIWRCLKIRDGPSKYSTLHPLPEFWLF